VLHSWDGDWVHPVHLKTRYLLNFWQSFARFARSPLGCTGLRWKHPDDAHAALFGPDRPIVSHKLSALLLLWQQAGLAGVVLKVVTGTLGATGPAVVVPPSWFTHKPLQTPPPPSPPPPPPPPIPDCALRSGPS